MSDVAWATTPGIATTACATPPNSTTRPVRAGPPPPRDIDFIIATLGLHPDDRLLAIGCGWGRHTRVLRERCFARPTSVDIAPAMLAEARAHTAGLDADLRECDFRAPADDGLFDALLSLYDRSCVDFPTVAANSRQPRDAARDAPAGWATLLRDRRLAGRAPHAATRLARVRGRRVSIINEWALDRVHRPGQRRANNTRGPGTSRSATRSAW